MTEIVRHENRAVVIRDNNGSSYAVLLVNTRHLPDADIYDGDMCNGHFSGTRKGAQRWAKRHLEA